MSDDLVERLRTFDIYDYVDADKICREAADRIAELEATLATARRDGMEEAAKIAENHSDLKGAELLKRFSKVTVARGTNIFTKREIAAAIRAALAGGKDE